MTVLPVITLPDPQTTAAPPVITPPALQIITAAQKPLLIVDVEPTKKIILIVHVV